MKQQPHILSPLLMAGALIVACGTNGGGPVREHDDGEELAAVEEVRLDGTLGSYTDWPVAADPEFPDDTDEISEAQWEEEEAKTDAADEAEAAEVIGNDEDDVDFEDVDLPTEPESAFEEGAMDLMSSSAHHPVSCRKRIYVAIEARGGLPAATMGWRQDPPFSCWYPNRLVQDEDWRGCSWDAAPRHEGGHHWYYDATSRKHKTRADEQAKVQSCAQTSAFGYEVLRNSGGWRFVQAPRVGAYLAQLFTSDDDIDSLWYKPKAYRKNDTFKKHPSGPGINIGADRPLLEIAKEVYKVCKKVRNRGHLYLYSTKPLRGMRPGLSFSQQSRSSKRLALVVKALDRCTKRRVADDGCFIRPEQCKTSQVCAWNGKSYCCRTPAVGLVSCIWDSHCAKGEVCAKGRGGYYCTKPMCGTIAPPKDGPGGATIPPTYFGMHVHNLATPVQLSFGTLRLWDANSSWALLEPTQGVFDWGKLDERLEAAEKAGAEVIYTFGRVPTWASSDPTAPCALGTMGCAAPPKDLAIWDAFVTAIVQHAAGRIRNWELWNEPNHTGFYQGDVATLVEMAKRAYAIIKSLQPDARVLSPCPTNSAGGPADWLESYFAAGGGAYTDVVSFHGYGAPGNPESLAARIGAIRAVMRKHGIDSKPLWDSEASWATDASLSDEAAQTALLARYYILHWSSGVGRFAWYAYDNSKWGTLWSDTGLRKPGVAYGQVYQWLVGANMFSACRQGEDMIFRCGLGRAAGYEAQVIWSPGEVGQTTELSVPSRFKQWRDLTGAKGTTAGGLQVGPMPILLETSDPPL